MHPVVLGISHRTAPLELRERLALTRDDCLSVADRLLADGVAAEAVVLSTCNRTEVYLAGADARAAEPCVLGLLCECGRLEADELSGATYCATGDAAVTHLFRVAASLDSMVVGEAQVLAQLRDAFEAARRAGATGAVFNRLFRQAIEVGKRVRAETAIAERPVSVSSAAVDLARQVLGALDDRVVLVLGAGETSELTVESLQAQGAGAVIVVNRTLETAEELAARCHGRAVCLGELDEHLAAADIVISSTAAPGLVVDRARLEPVMDRRPHRPLLLVDLAVPRDLDPAIAGLAGCHLCDIDDLQAVVAADRSEREREIAQAQLIVGEEVERLNAWIAERHVVPTISRLRDSVEGIRAAEVARQSGRLASLSAEQRDEVDQLTVAIVRKILHLPTVRLKELAGTPGAAACVEALWRLFDLDVAPPVDDRGAAAVVPLLAEARDGTGVPLPADERDTMGVPLPAEERDDVGVPMAPERPARTALSP